MSRNSIQNILCTIVLSLLMTIPALAASEPAHGMAEYWATSGRDLILYAGPGEDRKRVCPRLPGRATQPFCRKFPAAVLTACGYLDQVQIVLANGDIHQVDFAMIGSEGKFDPIYQPGRPLTLESAWMPQILCDLSHGSADVLAVDKNGGLLHFDGHDWQAIDPRRTLSSIQ